jgi:hypothetical protein
MAQPRVVLDTDIASRLFRGQDLAMPLAATNASPAPVATAAAARPRSSPAPAAANALASRTRLRSGVAR